MDNSTATVAKQELLSHFDGYVCSDKRGLCIEAQGIMPTKSAGFSKSLVECAQALSQDDNVVITIQGSNGIIVAKQVQDISIAVIKKSQYNLYYLCVSFLLLFLL
ncbi:Two tm domain ATPase [Entamoeba marina]